MGVLWGIEIATGNEIFIEGGEGSHPATMVVGFLIPVSMGLTEWGLRYGRVPLATRWGKVQVALPFFGGLSLMLGLLTGILPLVMISLPFEILGTVVYIARMWPEIRSTKWLQDSHERFLGLAMLALPIDVGYLVYLISNYADDFDLAPVHLLLAMDHLMFIGVVTNPILALLTLNTRDRRNVWPWANTLIFAGVNIGIAGFVLGLTLDEAALKQSFTPILGAGLLLAVATFMRRLQSKGDVAEVA